MPITSKITKLAAGAILLFSTSISMTVPSTGAPFVVAPVVEFNTARDLPVQKVQQIYRKKLGSLNGSRSERELRRWNRNQNYRSHNPGRWKHRHNRHRGHRHHGSHLIGPAILGAIIGGAIVNSPNRYYSANLPAAHFRECDLRYRSYRATDNTFQPYNGPRRQCVTRYFP